MRAAQKQRHLEQTRRHITNVEKVFELVGETAHEEECIGFEGLKKEQLPSGYWHNTQDNMYGLVALADYARVRGKGSAQVVVKLDGKKIAARTVQGGRPLVLRRSLDKVSDLRAVGVEPFMTRQPRRIDPDKLAVEAVEVMETGRPVMALLVVDTAGRLVGVLHMHDLIRARVI